MRASRLAPAALLVFLLAGCSLSPAFLVDRPAIARCLPDGVRMDDFVERGPAGLKITVGEKLARIGATPGRDGKLCDRSGRRIEFFQHYQGGMPLPAGMMEEAQRHLEELKKTCTVIEIRRDPDLPPPV
jgi:hypothetical protein